MTAIADIIVNKSNPVNLQFSQNINDSQIKSNSSGFADLVSFYKNSDNNDSESKTENVKSEEKNQENNEKTESINETEKSEKVTDSADVKETEKTEEKISEKIEKSVKKVSDVEEKNNETKEIKSDDSKNKVLKAEKSEKKETARKSSDKKLENENLQYFEEYTASLMNNQKPDAKQTKELKIEAKNLSSEKIEINAENEVPLQNQLLQVKNSEANNEMDFSEFGKKDSLLQKKESKIDKEGKITVQDLRTEKPEITETKNQPKLKTSLKVTSENTATMTINITEENVQSDVLSLNNQSAGANGSNFQAMLNNQIQTNVPEFVKAGNIVLKDNNQGQINLVLHPDDLGNVKIHLSLDGKNLTGHITVATKEAMEVFKDNSETLREAFIKNGFENASFDVAFGNGGNSNQGFGFEERKDGSEILGKHMYGSVSSDSDAFDSEISGIQESFGNYSVNIVA